MTSLAAAGLALTALSLTSSALAAPSGPPAGADTRHLAPLVQAIADRAAAYPITGMTIGVAVDGQPVLVRGYGIADLSKARPATAKTVYEIGSITKQFTAAAVLRLAEQGKLRLDDPVGAYVPAVAARATDVTLRHLLSHTSGLYSGSPIEDLTVPTTPDSAVRAVADHAVESAPGTRYRYNNNGYQLLGLVVEKASGQPWASHVKAQFLAPLGLRDTGVCSEKTDARRARAYRHDTHGDAPPQEHERHHPSTGWAAGALCSTAGDMLAWQQALVSGRVVSPASYALMTTATVLASGKPAPYGIGMFVDQADGEPYLHHGGAASGFLSQLAWYPQQRVGVVVLSNGAYAGSLVELVEQAVARAAQGKPQAAAVDVPVSIAELDRYAGTYMMGPMKIRVYRQGAHLRAEPEGQAAGRLLHLGDHRFVAEHDPAIEVRFETAGAATHLRMRRRGQDLPPATRM